MGKKENLKLKKESNETTLIGVRKNKNDHRNTSVIFRIREKVITLNIYNKGICDWRTPQFVVIKVQTYMKLQFLF